MSNGNHSIPIIRTVWCL